MRSEGRSVCHISHLELLFGLNILSRTQRATEVKIFVGVSLKPSRQRSSTAALYLPTEQVAQLVGDLDVVGMQSNMAYGENCS